MKTYQVFVYLNNELQETHSASNYVNAKVIEYNAMCKYNGLCQVFIRNYID